MEGRGWEGALRARENYGGEMNSRLGETSKVAGGSELFGLPYGEPFRPRSWFTGIELAGAVESSGSSGGYNLRGQSRRDLGQRWRVN